MRRILAAIFAASLGLLLARAAWQRPDSAVDLPRQVAQALPESGVSHPVTAVLLNFRSYDTLLEIAVLLVAVITGLALRHVQPDRHHAATADSALLSALARILLPVLLLVAGYLLWAGSSRPGGAFQAGAVLAAAGVLMRLAGMGLPPVLEGLLLKLGLAGGLIVFLAVGSLGLPAGREFLAYPPDWAGALILLVEVALTLSIGLILFALFGSAPPAPGGGGRRDG